MKNKRKWKKMRKFNKIKWKIEFNYCVNNVRLKLKKEKTLKNHFKSWEKQRISLLMF